MSANQQPLVNGHCQDLTHAPGTREDNGHWRGTSPSYENELSRKLSQLRTNGSLDSHGRARAGNGRAIVYANEWRSGPGANQPSGNGPLRDIDLQLPSNAEVDGALRSNLENEAYSDFPSKESWYEASSVTSATPPADNVYMNESFQGQEEAYSSGVPPYFPPQQPHYAEYGQSYLASIGLITTSQRNQQVVTDQAHHNQLAYYATSFGAAAAGPNDALLLEMAQGNASIPPGPLNATICLPVSGPSLGNGHIANGNGNTPPLAQAHVQTQLSSQANNLYKTELCRSWEETGHCRYGSKCQVCCWVEDIFPSSEPLLSVSVTCCSLRMEPMNSGRCNDIQSTRLRQAHDLYAATTWWRRLT